MLHFALICVLVAVFFVAVNPSSGAKEVVLSKENSHLEKSVNGALPTTSSSTSSSEDGVENLGLIGEDKEVTVTITVVGASGDLAKKKIFPALFALYYEDCFPKV